MAILFYIDPGSGSLFIQFLIALVVGIGVFFRRIKYYILSLFNKKPEEEQDDAEPTND